jgi:membrane associated rhomboid family serine protease
MGYKILGFAVWQGAKLYLRRRMSGVALKAALGGVAAALVAGVIVAGKQQQSSS